MGTLGLNSHSRCALPPKAAAFTGLLVLKTSMRSKSLPVTQSQLQGGPELQQGARPCEEGIGQTPGRSRQDAIRLVARVPCYSPSRGFLFFSSFFS